MSQQQIRSTPLVPQVSDYLDYRKYLKDFFEYKKALTQRDYRPYSYQMFSAAADIKSPNYLKMIIEGKRNLSEDMISKFAKAMGLLKDQGDEFALLVKFNQTEDSSERNLYLKKLSELRVQNKLKTGEIDRKTWEKIPNWAAWVIYAMIDQEGAQFDVNSLKKLLKGKASDEEIKIALQSLVSSGQLEQDSATGELRKANRLAEAAEEIPVALVRKLQSQLMSLGLESLYEDLPTQREFGTLTLSLTQQEFEEVKFKLRQMRKALHKDNAIAREKTKGEKVYQLNIQLFPVTLAASVVLPLADTVKTTAVNNLEIIDEPQKAISTDADANLREESTIAIDAQD